MVGKVTEIDCKKVIARKILEALPDWFGIPEAREEYISDSIHQQFYVAMEHKIPIGFLCLKETGKDTVELAVMGVLKEFHRHGIGRELFNVARNDATEMGYSFLQVKTVQLGRYKEYDVTNKFYISLGFKEFEIFPTLWDKQNPCQVYVMSFI
ncbi:GNAT family N-acetyltransferase [Allofournierella sp.]|uniref:GNAT family N-acetyltransferase n=1 Tax=Allofournierella sp. TaxID=1940256 RepID=UPI003AF09FC2